MLVVICGRVSSVCKVVVSCLSIELLVRQRYVCMCTLYICMYVYIVYMWPHTKCTELSLPPFRRSRSSPCTICTHLRQAETCLCSGWSLNLEWPPFVYPLAP